MEVLEDELTTTHALALPLEVEVGRDANLVRANARELSMRELSR